MQRRPGGGSPSSANTSSPKVTGLLLRLLRRFSVLGLLGLLLVVLFFTFCLHAAVPESRPARPLAFLRGSGGSGDESRQQPTEATIEESAEAEDTVEAPEASGALLQEVVHSGETRVRGASESLQKRYAKQRQAGSFTCFDNSRSFHDFSVVNDDYCDCEDGSDEPGTSACAGLETLRLEGFSCTWASEGTAHAGPAAVVRLGAVNDGICDCCGGEDEWAGEVSCPNRCLEMAKAEREEASKAMKGSRAREAYVRRAVALRGKPRFKDVDGGPDGVYLAAAEDGCLKMNDGDFQFEVCLFDKVTQKDRKNGGSYTLGKGGSWATSLWENGQHRKDYSTLVMDGGTYCAPASGPRKAEIHFECAVKPALVAVQETQVCVYGIRMQTPAACHSLQHHDD
eukprot:TRINITY_DN102535_c0_g1_i1.p1 TRINITY_DN102535_c0_g1~~TRINITY_DN102535_c0_g1_i1.p1  ORF type:complete len:397 (+),score=92.38 TRINITY_DN102535_c0_g1_i1:101-1291(+)